MTMYVVKLFSGKVIGPFNSSDLKEALQNGRISGDDLVRRTDGGDFVPIRSVRGLKDLIRPTVNTKTHASTPSQSASDAAFSIPSTPTNFSSSSAASFEESSSGLYPTPNGPPLDAGDKVLRLAFSVGRWFSIILISLCAIGLTGAIIFYLMNSGFEAKPAVVNQTIRAASTLEFIETCRVLNQPSPSSNGGQSPVGSYRAGGGIDPCQKYRRSINEITQALGITGTTNRSGASSGDVICGWIEEIPMSDKEQFINDFIAFAKSFQATTPKPANCDGAQAATFFHEHFVAALNAREQQEKAAALAAAQENTRRRMQQEMAVNAGAIAIATLLVFLFFPLLIQIERNTRPIGL